MAAVETYIEAVGEAHKRIVEVTGQLEAANAEAATSERTCAIGVAGKTLYVDAEDVSVGEVALLGQVGRCS